MAKSQKEKKKITAIKSGAAAVDKRAALWVSSSLMDLSPSVCPAPREFPAGRVLSLKARTGLSP